jgi:hypothetical protein
MGFVADLFGGGGGGDGGASARAAADEAKKKAAREAVNRMFGYGPAVPATRTPIIERRQQQPVMTDEGVRYPRRNRGGDEGGDDTGDSGYEDVVVGYNETPGSDPTVNRAEREAQIQKVVSANRDLNKLALDEQKQEADRELMYALSRSGLRGGSADVDESAKLNRTYADNLRKSIAGADEIGANLRAADEDARMRLLSQVEAGSDAESALAGAGQQLQANIDIANAKAQGNILNNAFADIGSTLKKASERRAYEREAARNRSPLLGSPSATYPGTFVP